MKNLHLSDTMRKFFAVALALAVIFTFSAAAPTAPVAAFDSVTITVDDTTTSDGLMGGIVGMLLTIVRYVGIGILVWGIVEIVLSVTQDMPDKKIKGIMLAFSGALCIALKTVLVSLHIIA